MAAIMVEIMKHVICLVLQKIQRLFIKSKGAKNVKTIINNKISEKK